MARLREGFQVEARLVVPGITIELCHGVVPAESDFVLNNDEHFLTMGLSAPPDLSECHIPDPYSPTCYKIGNLSLRPAHIAHRIVSGPGRFRYLSFRIDPAWFSERTGIGSDWDWRAGFDVMNPEIDSFLLRLEREVSAPGPASRVLVEGLSLAVAADLSRVLNGPQRLLPEVSGKLSAPQLRRITDYVETLDGEAPSVADIAELVGMSSRHLMRTFKRTTNLTVYEFIMRTRMHRARDLLGETRLLVKEIAHKLGFATIESFSTAFRTATGESPVAFRRRVLLNNRGMM